MLLKRQCLRILMSSDQQLFSRKLYGRYVDPMVRYDKRVSDKLSDSFRDTKISDTCVLRLSLCMIGFLFSVDIILNVVP